VNAGRGLLVAVAVLPLAVPLAWPAGPARFLPDSCIVAPAPSLDSLVAASRYWHAWRAQPALPRDPRALRTRDALLRIRIAEGLQQWSQLETILARARGVDANPDLLAAAARQDERNERWASAAARYRRLAALAEARPALKASAAVRLAVAFERLALPDSAEAAWHRAAQALPDLSDWFALHRAEFEVDTSLAFASVAVMRSPGAAEGADDLLARRRLASGNPGGALAAYLRRGRLLDAARVEVLLGRGDVARGRVDGLLTADPGRPVALLAANFIAAQVAVPTADEWLGIARAYRARGDLLSAERYVRRALERRDTSLAAWLELAGIAAARHRTAAARDALDSARAVARRRPGTPATVLAPASVQVLGSADRWEEADSVVARLARANPGDSSVAAAVLLLANHERAQGTRESEAGWYRVLARRFGETRAADVARFRLALGSYAAGFRDSASAGLAEVLVRDTARRLGLAPRYWGARIARERQEEAGAAALRAIAAEDPTGYYGVRAHELLGDSLPLAPDSTLPPPRPGSSSAARAADRIRLLAAVGFEREARAEAVAWTRDSSASPQLLVAAAGAAAEAGMVREAIVLGAAARARAGITRGVAAALFPLRYRAVIEAEATEHCVDPLLLAAIIRQESRFEPRARSRAGARGLSQLLPRTAQQMSRREGMRSWDPALLDVPDFNLHFGARYVHDRLMHETLPGYAVIASYDAGPERLARWRQWPEFGDPDLFVERLSIAETRDYVRNVYANYAWYRRVYGAQGGWLR
jgi:soluble lytic murein transglycosylase-like protein